ncbi:MAG: ABC transporter ATP-binding protein [Chloroflexi bacterium]|nr:MAG: ABC transporter ATP-binding protein [Chloroflexota bacterium]
MREILLELRNLHAGYGEVKVLNGVELLVREGEIVSVVGPNGSGKSTMMKTIFGLLKPEEGKIIYKGEDITALEPFEIIKRGICYVPQEHNVFPSLTVEENLEMGAYILDSPEELKKGKERVYELFPPLKERANSAVRTLSGGMRQMVAFGRALMLNPDLLLLDEPSAGLAPKLVEDIITKLQGINMQGVSLLLIEQNVRRALELCDRGYVLDGGKTALEGSSEELLSSKRVQEIYMGGAELE